jgi:hypothetical protein
LTDVDDLKRMYDARPQSPEAQTLEASARARNYVMSLRRKLFFEGDFPVLEDASRQKVLVDELVPYVNLMEFMQ